MRIGVLSNLRTGRREVSVARVRRVLQGRRDVLHLETNSSQLVAGALERFAEADVELLVVNGGDGTVQHVLTELLTPKERQWMPRIAPIAGGRTNMVALELGAPRDPARGLRRLLALAAAGQIDARSVEHPVLRVDLAGELPPQYGMFFGAGVLHRAIELTHRSFPEGKAQGLFGAAVVMATLIARAATGRRGGVLTPDKMQIALDDEALPPEEFLLVMATTLRRLFFGIEPFWGQGPAPLRFTAIASGARRLALAAPGILVGRPPAHATPEAGYWSRNAAEATVRLDSGVTLDGELFGPLPGRLARVSARERVRFVRA
jgi:diacylglycerol kinase family enzyme